VPTISELVFLFLARTIDVEAKMGAATWQVGTVKPGFWAIWHANKESQKYSAVRFWSGPSKLELRF
jgi:hypothetical protein